MGDTVWYLGPMGTHFVVVGHEGYLLILGTHGYMLIEKVLDLWILIIDINCSCDIIGSWMF